MKFPRRTFEQEMSSAVFPMEAFNNIADDNAVSDKNTNQYHAESIDTYLEEVEETPV